MYEEDFATRLAFLRNAKKVSARDMSLSIGQNPGYINNIETGKAMPSMSAFFFICEYLNVSPHDFFDNESQAPSQISDIIGHLKQLSPEQLSHIAAIVSDLAK